MLLLDSRTWEINGVTVFPDHADKAQFYYMPAAPHLTVRREGGASFPQFSLILFKDAAGDGGFLNFDVNLGLEPDQFAAVKTAVANQADVDGDIRLSPLPVVGGTVRLLMLGKDSGADLAPDDPDAAAAAAADASRWVEAIDHASSPSLYGDNQATFSVQLSANGAKLVNASLAGEILPVAVVYSLEYLGLRPAFAVSLKIDWDRVQKHMDESFGVNLLFVSTEIGKAVDELIENKAIDFEVDSFITEDAEAEGGVSGRRDAAIAQVKAMITETFFQPSLPPWKPDGKEWAEDLKKAQDVMAMVGGGPAGSTFKGMFSYKKTEYQRTDKKSLNVRFAERQTVKRTIYPQGHLQGLTQFFREPGVDIEHYVSRVDLNDPWFNRRKLDVSSTADFDLDKIATINVRAKYGAEPKNAILTKATPTASFEWSSQLDGHTMRMPVEISYEIGFAGVDTSERPAAVTSPSFVEDTEHLVVNPRKIYAQSRVPIEADTDFPWDEYPGVDVAVRYLDPANNLAEAELFRLSKEMTRADWDIFMLDTKHRGFDYRLTFRNADHQQQQGEWITCDDEEITVSPPPSATKLRLKVRAAADWTKYASCFVNLIYADPAGGVSDQRSLELRQGAEEQTAVFSLKDPAARTVRFSATFLTIDGQISEIPESDTKRELIIVTPTMKGRRQVEVRPPADFAGQHLLKATAELRFEDFAAGIKTDDSFIFGPGSAAETFEYEFADATRAKYERRVTYLFDNGMKRVVEWEADDKAVLQLTAP